MRVCEPPKHDVEHIPQDDHGPNTPERYIKNQLLSLKLLDKIKTNIVPSPCVNFEIKIPSPLFFANKTKHLVVIVNNNDSMQCGASDVKKLVTCACLIQSL